MRLYSTQCVYHAIYTQKKMSFNVHTHGLLVVWVRALMYTQMNCNM